MGSRVLPAPDARAVLSSGSLGSPARCPRPSVLGRHVPVPRGRRTAGSHWRLSVPKDARYRSKATHKRQRPCFQNRSLSPPRPLPKGPSGVRVLVPFSVPRGPASFLEKGHELCTPLGAAPPPATTLMTITGGGGSGAPGRAWPVPRPAAQPLPAGGGGPGAGDRKLHGRFLPATPRFRGARARRRGPGLRGEGRSRGQDPASGCRPGAVTPPTSSLPVLARDTGFLGGARGTHGTRTGPVPPPSPAHARPQPQPTCPGCAPRAAAPLPGGAGPGTVGRGLFGLGNALW